MSDKVKLIIEIPKYYLEHPQDYTCLAECVRRGTHLSKTMQDIKTDIWYSGMNMAGEYKGVWVRYKTIEEIIDKHIERGDSK